MHGHREYKTHPKMLEIQEEKRRRRQQLLQAYSREAQQLAKLKVDRKEYMEENKKSINDKLQQIHKKNVERTNKIKEEEEGRYGRIQQKMVERLEKLVPERARLIQQLKRQTALEEDARKKKKEEVEAAYRLEKEKIIRQLMECPQVQQEFLSTNQGECVICLSANATLMMENCRHLVSCTNCQYILRMLPKCPLCRKPGKYISIYSRKKKTK